MAAGESRLAFLMELRRDLFKEMAEAEQALSQARLRVEQMESDLRIGLPEPPEYGQIKGHAMPQAEARVVELFRELLKLEDKINAMRSTS